LALLVVAFCSAPAFAKGVAYAAEATSARTKSQQENAPAESNSGLVIVGVDATGPAAQAGIVRGDILQTVGDVPVASTATLYGLVTSRKVGDQVVLVVKHGDETRSFAVTLGDRERRPYLGVQVVDSPSAIQSPQVAEAMPAAPASSQPVTTTVVTATVVSGGDIVTVAPGLIVAQVVDGGPAAMAGVAVGDLISAIDGPPIASYEDVVNALKRHTPGEVATLRVQKGGPVGAMIVDIPVTLGAAPDDPARAYLGLSFIPTAAGVTIEKLPPSGAYSAPAMPVAPPLPPAPGMVYNYTTPTTGQACGTTIQQYFYAPAMPPLPAMPAAPFFIYQSGVNAEAYPYPVPSAVSGQEQGDVVVYSAQPVAPSYPGTVVYGSATSVAPPKPVIIAVRKAADQDGNAMYGSKGVPDGYWVSVAPEMKQFVTVDVGAAGASSAGGGEVVKVAPGARKFVIIRGGTSDNAAETQAVPVPVPPMVDPAGDGWY
jgi:PDZ domain-containing secreted protein